MRWKPALLEAFVRLTRSGLGMRQRLVQFHTDMPCF